jgi:hypothetical protein
MLREEGAGMRRRVGVLGVLGLGAWLFAASPVPAQVPDHLKCYKVKDALSLAGTADLDTPQFGADPACRVSKAKLFCVPATKTGVAVTDRATGTLITPLPVSGPQPGDRMCYKVRCPNLPPDQSVTDQFGNRTLSKLRAALLCTPAFKGSARYIDNGDGTVTDNYTGLQWEKKDGIGSGADPGNPHDLDNTYTWSTSGATADGTAFTDFLYRLNTCTSTNGNTVTGGFAGHCDWRLPTIAELQTIVDCSFGSPCIDPVFGPTAAFDHWSSTASDSLSSAWYVYFGDGSLVATLGKLNVRRVRAVRGS